MITSMTAFARLNHQFEGGVIIWEIKSVNHRYMELTVRLPELFREFEFAVREQVSRYLKRGKIECQMKYQARPGTSAEFSVNKNLLSQLAQVSSEVQTIIKEIKAPTILEILSWPGVLQSTEMEVTSLQSAIMMSLEQTLRDIVAMRQREGQALQVFIVEHLHKILDYVHKVKQRVPIVLAHQRERILARINELKLEVNQERIEQEWLLLAQKMDVTEEVERLDTHVAEVHHTLTAGGVVGRQLDFLMQELNREANTLAAKSVDTEITHAAVELKVLIEQIREQVQNIE